MLLSVSLDLIYLALLKFCTGAEGILGLGLLMDTGEKGGVGCGTEEKVIQLDSGRGMGEGIGEVMSRDGRTDVRIKEMKVGLRIRV